MPSPLPGMDPWLEHPAIFPDLHGRLITYLSGTINKVLPEPYYSSISDRVWVDLSQRRIEPDVNVMTKHPKNPAATGPSLQSTALLEETQATPVIIHVPHDETRETFLEIFSQSGEERLVTTVEILSLANKRSGEQGRDLYLKKQKEVLGSRVHLVEIDLLRGGLHSTAVPRERVEDRVGPFHYHVSIHRYDAWEDYTVYPWLVGTRLPKILIPLLPEDPPVSIDLQPLLDQCYDEGNYARRARYRERPPVPPLSAEQQAWAEGRLAAAGA